MMKNRILRFILLWTTALLWLSVAPVGGNTALSSAAGLPTLALHSGSQPAPCQGATLFYTSYPPKCLTQAGLQVSVSPPGPFLRVQEP